jgi:homospermidine synthase
MPRSAQKSGRTDRRLVLRRQPRHGLLVRQAGARQPRPRSGDKAPEPKTKDEWGRLAQRLGVKGVHIAERDTQRAKSPKPRNVFVNTWSIEGFLSEGMQPAELGWGTHEKWAPANAGFHNSGCGAAIYLNQPGANTRVRSWTPTARAQFGFLVTHNESISIADYYTVRDDKGEAVYRPTCHYAYHPCDDAVLSLHELFGRAGEIQSAHHILGEAEILDGVDELGVLLYGHARNAYWYGSQLSVEETRALAPYQNATGMQVTSAVLAGMVWALENPNAGIVEADEIQLDLGPVIGAYTDAAASRVPGSSALSRPGRSAPTPTGRRSDRPARPSGSPRTSTRAIAPWQFRNVLVRCRARRRCEKQNAKPTRPDERHSHLWTS